ncbi:MAG TPA: thermonuclease family protein [Pyrinomonadaceae bacterium]|jgi:endonuclease YncB( thermonuclease family)|nr:thermonuclease family protein [Pyrinomonadaceae bacterium]
MKRYILALAIIISCFVCADAATLFGKVVEVNSGDVITIHNLNRPVRVRLMGVDAPEMNQSFGDVAKKHLTDLVFEKSVLVEYAGIGADSSLTGRVLLNDADIGAQMIRDGVAWFDPVNGNRLSATDREVYQQSEHAARNEKRGLWQDENAVAPWEFVKAEKMRLTPVASPKETVAETKPRRSGPVPELTSLTLRIAGIHAEPSQPARSESDFAWARSTARKNWSRMQPRGENFSIEIPEDGEHLTKSVPEGDEMVETHTYLVRDGWTVYSLLWFKGPTLGETDELASKSLLRDFLKGAEQGYQSGGGETGFKCEPRGRKNVSQNGYTGFEYDLSSCTVPSRVRLYTKVVDNKREVYIATAVYGEEDENVTRFLKSFTIGRSSTAKLQ